MGSKGFNGEDWLGSYLSTTKYARDPKLNADPGSASLKKRTKGAPQPEAHYVPQGPHASDIGAAQKGAPGDPAAPSSTSAYNLAAAQRSSNRRRSWAAPPSLVRGSGGRANAAEAAATAAIAAASAAAAAATSRVHGDGSSVVPSIAARAPGRAAPASPAPASAAPASPVPAAGKTPSPTAGDLASLTAAAAAVVEFSGHDRGAPRKRAGGDAGGRPLENSSEAWQDEFGTRTSNFRRKSFSGSGRRASLDYTDLEAVKERVQQAASLWAVAEDHERDSISSTGSNPAGRGHHQAMMQGPRAAAAAAQAAAAAAKTMGATGLMEDDEDDDEDDADVDIDTDVSSRKPRVHEAETSKLSVEVGAAAASPGPTAQGPDRPQKKVSLIKKWLVFRR